jgi:Zn-finger nucleic acid-binding protein
VSDKGNPDKIKLNVKNFVRDFTRGASEDELRERYRLKHRHLARLVGILKKDGFIDRSHEAQRKENLRIRFGDHAGPPKDDAGPEASVDLDSGLVLHCPSCGASVKRGASNCEYCSSALDFSLKGKTANCPHCYAKIAADSRFCFRCARPAKAGIEDGKVLKDRPCPRCGIAMRGTRIRDYPLVGCTKCEGLFVSHDSFEMMQDGMSRTIVPTGRRVSRPTFDDKLTAYVRCPVCRHMMNRTNFATISGVLVDTCRDHGIWFDSEELEKIMEFIAHGGLQRAKAKDMERLKHEDELRRLRAGVPRPEGGTMEVRWGATHGLSQAGEFAGVLKDIMNIFRS